MPSRALIISRFQDTGCKPWTPRVRQPLLTGLLLKLPRIFVMPLCEVLPPSRRGKGDHALGRGTRGTRRQRDPGINRNLRSSAPLFSLFVLERCSGEGARRRLILLGPCIRSDWLMLAVSTSSGRACRSVRIVRTDALMRSETTALLHTEKLRGRHRGQLWDSQNVIAGCYICEAGGSGTR